MNILGINTTSKICEVSLKIKDSYKILKADKLNVNIHSDRLLPMIDEILKQNHLKIQDVNHIVVNIGPGSFTGIRVGVVVARTIAQLLNIKISGCCGLDVFMFKYLKDNPNNNKKIAVLLDALRSEYFTAIYNKDGKKETDYQILKKENIDFSDKILVEAGDELGVDLIKFSEFAQIESQNYQDLKPIYIRKTSAEERVKIPLQT